MPSVAALALVPALALAAPPPTAQRLAVLLVPLDQGAEAASLELEGHIVEALQEYPNIISRNSEQLFGLPANDQAEASLRRAEQGYSEGLDAFKDRALANAELKLRATIKEYGRAVAAMKDCERLCDAIALYAASLHARGDVEEARFALLDLLALSPDYELPKGRFSPELAKLKDKVAQGREAQMRGALTVSSTPAGARVYVDGKLEGYTPLTLPALRTGRHLVRLERPGFRKHGELVEVLPDGAQVTVELSPTGTYRAYQRVQKLLVSEAVNDQGGSTMATVGKTLGVDRAFMGVLKVTGDGAKELSIGLFELSAGKRIAWRRVHFQGDEFGQLKSEVAKVVHALLDPGAGARTKKGGDPLDGRTGTEDWSRAGSGGPTRRRRAEIPSTACRVPRTGDLLVDRAERNDVDVRHQLAWAQGLTTGPSASGQQSASMFAREPSSELALRLSLPVFEPGT